MLVLDENVRMTDIEYYINHFVTNAAYLSHFVLSSSPDDVIALVSMAAARQDMVKRMKIDSSTFFIYLYYCAISIKCVLACMYI